LAGVLVEKDVTRFADGGTKTAIGDNWVRFCSKTMLNSLVSWRDFIVGKLVLYSIENYSWIAIARIRVSVGSNWALNRRKFCLIGGNRGTT